MDPYISIDSLDRENPYYPMKIENQNVSEGHFERGDSFLESMPVKIKVQTTDRCNLQCPHCQLTGSKRNSDMDLHIFNKLSDELFPTLLELHPSDIGEPMASPWFISMCEKMRRFGVLLDLTTNGTLLDQKRIECIAPIARDVKVSFDGATDRTFERFRRGASFDDVKFKVRKMVAAMSDAQVPNSILSLQMTLMKSNFNELPSLVSLASELGVSKVKAYHLFSFNNEMDSESLMSRLDDYSIVLEESLDLAASLGVAMECAEPSGGSIEDLQKVHCHLPWYECFIGTDGRVFPCHSHGGTFLGNVSNNTIMEIWNSIGYQGIRSSMESDDAIWNCHRCGMRYHARHDHQPVPLDPENFLFSFKHRDHKCSYVRWSGRMKQFDLDGGRRHK